MNTLPNDADELWEEPKERREFKKVMLKFMLLGFLQGAKEVGGSDEPESLMSAAKRFSYDSKSLEYAARAVGTTKKALQREIDAAIENGESVKQLAKRIDSMFGRTMGYRSVRIARTQLTDTVGDGNLTALIADGETEKEWSTVLDSRERDSHHDADGQVVPIHDTFTVGGSPCQRPGDDSLPPEEKINCRCDCVRPRMSERAKRQHGRLFLRVHGSLEKRYVLSLRRAFRDQRDRVLSRLAS